jgi:hypothetical protein
MASFNDIAADLCNSPTDLSDIAAEVFKTIAHFNYIAGRGGEERFFNLSDITCRGSKGDIRKVARFTAALCVLGSFPLARWFLVSSLVIGPLCLSGS